MKVKATKKGYFNNKRVYEGEVIVLEDEKLFSKSWMEEVEELTEVKKPVKKEKKLKEVPLSQASKANESFEDDSSDPTGSQEVI